MPLRRLYRFGLAAGAVGACALCARDGDAAEDSKKACVAAFSNAQRLVRSGDLIDAREKLVWCSGPRCPEVMQPDCQEWLARVDASMPTIVFRVESRAAPPPLRARVSIDGGDWTALDGRALSVNPGEHQISIMATGFVSAERTIMVAEGEKLRQEVLELTAVPADTDSAPAPVKDSEAPKSRLTLPIVIAASAAALSGVGAVYFGTKARSDERQLTSCAPDCSSESVTQVKREYLLTNLSIGAAAAGLAAAGLLLVIDLRAGKPRTTSLNVGADASGLGAFMVGTF